jgi:DNA-binding NarL/FixJ family response regulator
MITMIRIVIIDGQDSDRHNTELLLSTQDDFTVVGRGKDGYDALKLTEMHKPEILLLDANLSYIDGAHIASILKYRFPHTSTIILTNMDDDTNALNAIGNGVSGYLLKNNDMAELAVVIRVVHAGGGCLSPSIAARLFSKVSRITRGERMAPPSPHFPVNLTRTELQIIQYVGQGLENQEIAEKLSLKIGTVRNYVTVILQKTALRNRVQLAVFAIQNGITQEVRTAA